MDSNRKKILVIMGSPRKGNTFRACEEIHGIMEQNFPVEFEYLWLKDVQLLPCKGCLACFTQGEERCPNHDDASLIAQKMLDADGVIFATPVYGLSVTGPMKVFIDRFSYNFHRPRFFDKKALLLTTTGFIGHKDVTKYLYTVARIWGFEVAGKAALVTPIPLPDYRMRQNQRTVAQAAGEYVSSLKRTVRKKPGLTDVIIFHGQRAAFSRLETLSPADYRYWKEQGWLSGSVHYFTNVPVNPLYRVIGMIVERISARQVRKDLPLDSGAVQ